MFLIFAHKVAVNPRVETIAEVVHHRHDSVRYLSKKSKNTHRKKLTPSSPAKVHSEAQVMPTKCPYLCNMRTSALLSNLFIRVAMLDNSTCVGDNNMKILRKFEESLVGF